MDAETFCRTNPVRDLLLQRAGNLKRKARELEALADALPEYLGSVDAENAMRALIVNGENTDG